ncbi:MAG: lactate utilization protein [Clostridia bacterium]|nr:lactate utilization protein [Clostridia bacterium]
MKNMNDSIRKTMENLNKNRMESFFVETKEEALKTALSLISDGDTVSVGGSVTLNEVGILEALKCGKYNYLDRYAASSPQEMHDIFRQSFSADAYFTSSNAVTEEGELFNCDGNANRVAAMMYGPKKVIVIVGKNKIVKDLDEALIRLKTVAAPLNAKRLNKETYCAKIGHCVTMDNGKERDMTCGCRSKDRICRNYTVMGEHLPDRVKVIIVNEDLGY